MYLHIGQGSVVHQKDILGIFDLDNTTSSPRTRKFLEQAEREGDLTAVFDDLPRSFVVCRGEGGRTKVWLSQFSSATLRARAENDSIE